MSTPATVEIWESNGAGEVPTKITGLSFGSVDAPNLVAVDHPLVIPASGNIYSYQKFTRWKVTAWVDTNTIDNLKWFNSGISGVSGWTELFSNSATQAYFTPDRSGTGGNTSPWPVNAGSAMILTGTISNPTTGYITTTYALMMLRISNSTPAGAKGVHTIVYRYDES